VVYVNSLTLIAKVPARNSESYLAKLRRIVKELSDYDLRVNVVVERGESAELYVLGEVIDLGRVSVSEAVSRVLSRVSIEVSDPDMLNKLAVAGAENTPLIKPSD
jgi:hypothetical protein